VHAPKKQFGMLAGGMAGISVHKGCKAGHKKGHVYQGYYEVQAGGPHTESLADEAPRSGFGGRDFTRALPR